MQPDCQVDGGLGVNLGRVKLENRIRDAEGRAVAAQLCKFHRMADGLFPQPFAAFKRFKRPGHSLGGQLGGKDAGAGGGGGGATLPHCQLAHAGDPQGDVWHYGQGNGVAHLLFVQPQHFAGGARGADNAEYSLIPLVVRHLVGNPAEHFIGQGDCGNHRAAVGLYAVRQGEGRRNHIAGMPAAGGEVGIIAVQIPDHYSVGKPGQIQGGAVVGA